MEIVESESVPRVDRRSFLCPWDIKDRGEKSTASMDKAASLTSTLDINFRGEHVKVT